PWLLVSDPYRTYIIRLAWKKALPSLTISVGGLILEVIFSCGVSIFRREMLLLESCHKVRRGTSGSLLRSTISVGAFNRPVPVCEHVGHKRVCRILVDTQVPNVDRFVDKNGWIVRRLTTIC